MSICPPPPPPPHVAIVLFIHIRWAPYHQAPKIMKSGLQNIIHSLLTTPENTITYHYALCLSAQNFA